MAGQRAAVAVGAAARPITLSACPAAHELVRALAQRLRTSSRWPKSGQMIYRGVRVQVQPTSLGRVLVSTLDGQPIGASHFGALWDD